MDTATTTEVKPALYVGTYAKYNDGSIEGKWLHLEDYNDAAEFFAACKKLHASEADPEYMFQDFEGFPKEFYSESMGTDQVQALFDYLQLSDEDRELLDEWCDATGEKPNEENDLENIRDNLFCVLDYTHSVDDNNAMGDYVVDNGLLDVPENLQAYINYEAIGRDWLMDMYVSPNGWVFTNQ